jgi:hypothetical protein
MVGGISLIDGTERWGMKTVVSCNPTPSLVITLVSVCVDLLFVYGRMPSPLFIV